MLKKLKGSYIDGTSTIFKESEHNFFFFFFFCLSLRILEKSCGLNILLYYILAVITICVPAVFQKNDSLNDETYTFTRNNLTK